MATIVKTKDYNLFKKHEHNRSIDQLNLKKIVASIQAQNLLEYRPLLVDEYMRVIDGQHRLEAAKILQVDIFYQVNRDSKSEDIILLNAHGKNWTINDYVDSFISKGNREYKKLKEFCQERDCPYYIAIRALKGDRDHTMKDFKNGLFKFTDEHSMDLLAQLLNKTDTVLATIKQYVLGHVKVIRSTKLKSAIISLLKNAQCDLDVLLNKIAYKADAIRPCADTIAYYSMLRDIYNWKNSNPIE